jgi:hypothetical protein
MIPENQDIENRIKLLEEKVQSIKLDKATAEEMYNRVSELITDLTDLRNELRGKKLPSSFFERDAKIEKRISSLEDRYNELQKNSEEFRGELKAPELPPNINDTLSNVEDRISTLESRYNELVKILQEEMKSIASEVSGSGNTGDVGDFGKQISELQKVLASREKDLSNYRKQMEERLKKIEGRKTVGVIPKDLVAELSSLKGIINQLTAENKEFNRVTREMRINQMASVDPEVFANLSDKVKTLKIKMLELEEMSKESSVQTRKEAVNKIRGIEEKVSGEIAAGMKEIEDKIKELEKRFIEESSQKPIILE